MMVISAGLDAKKPDHQHGDMLGVQAMANGHVILPNYQVRYSLKDFELFKNSMVKNVALVDNELQGKEYKSNKGGSGFGKFGKLPHPKTIAFKTAPDLDLYIGSHDGFKNIGVGYSRQVIYLKNYFWIVKDNFKAAAPHTYKQVWQGHYTFENAPDLLRATFDDGTGVDIYQLAGTDTVTTSGRRGKEWSVVSSKGKKEYHFITVVFPFNFYDRRIDEGNKNPMLKGWKINNSDWKMEGKQPISLTKGKKSVFFSVKKLRKGSMQIEFSNTADVFIKKQGSGNQWLIRSLAAHELQVYITGQQIKPESQGKKILKPGSTLRLKLQ